ncbi:MAG: GHKL domain-containing protein, partial [Clostridia bacterium]|nr:GHKL domain-containing protein [Clostridia bacterium]
DALKIIVRNTVLNKVEIKNNSVKTTKSDSENHGFGLNAIKTAARKYDGFVVLDCDESWFTLKIVLLLKGDVNE